MLAGVEDLVEAYNLPVPIAVVHDKVIPQVYGYLFPEASCGHTC